MAEALLGGGALLLRLADEGVGVVRHDELAVRRLHLPDDSDKDSDKRLGQATRKSDSDR